MKYSVHNKCNCRGKEAYKNEYKIQVVPGAAPAFQLSKDKLTDVVHHGRKQPPNPPPPFEMLGSPLAFFLSALETTNNVLATYFFPQKSLLPSVFLSRSRTLRAKISRKGGGEKAMLDRLGVALPGFIMCSEGAGFSP